MRPKGRSRISAALAAALATMSAAIAAAAFLSAASLDTDADRVLGQPGFIVAAPNFLDAHALDEPRAVAIDTAASPNHVFVADTANNRVLGWNNASALQNGEPADIVIGQNDFLSDAPNQGMTSPSAATLAGPMGVAVDGAHNLYVADSGNNRILEFSDPFAAFNSTPPVISGFVASIVFGQNGSFASADCNHGALGAASLCSPQGLAIDSAGNLFAADAGNNRVLVYYTPRASQSADLAIGQPDDLSNQCNGGGAATLSTLCLETAPGGLTFNGVGVAVDSAGNLYVADPGNDRALEYTGPYGSAGADSRSAHLDFTAVGAPGLDAPAGVAVDSSGDFYLSSVLTNQVFIFEAAVATSNTTAQLFLGPGAGAPSSVSFQHPHGLAFDSSFGLYIADTDYNRVVRYFLPAPQTSQANLELGQPGMGYGAPNAVDAIGLDAPAGVALDTSAGAPPYPLYVTDSANNRVLGWTDAASFASGAPAAIVVGQPIPLSYRCNNGSAPGDLSGIGPDSLCDPQGAAVDGAGNLFVADTGNNRVLEYASPIAAFNSSGQSAGFAASAVFGQKGSYTADGCNPGGIGAATLCAPQSAAFDSSGNLYIADTGNNRVLEFAPPFGVSPAAAAVFGQGGSFASQVCNLGALGAATLCAPGGVAADPAGNIYIADTANNRALEYDAPLNPSAGPGAGDTIADRVIGQPDFSSSQANNGGTGPATLASPAAVAVDRLGNLYVADAGNDRVLEYTDPALAAPGATIAATMVFGQGGSFTANGGRGGIAPGDLRGLGPDNLDSPAAAAIDPAGNVYMADMLDNRMLEFDEPVAFPTPTATATATPTATPSATATPTATATATATATPTATPTSTATPDPSGGTMAIAPRKLKFPSTGAGGAPVSRTLTISNRGKSMLGGSVSGAIDAPFSVGAGAGAFSIAPRGSRQVTVVFAPPHPGSFTAEITVTSGDPKHPRQTVAVAGKGLPGALVARRSLKFPKTAATGTSSATLVIGNRGKGILTGIVGGISGSSAFAVQSGGGAFTLAHGATDSVKIAFTPPAAGKLSASLAITSDDPKHQAVTVKLSGTGQ
jgi:sugar lactone lactonase YvrE